MNANVLPAKRVVTAWPKIFTAQGAPRELLELAALVVPQLLVGDHPTLAALRKQYERARIRGVELTGRAFLVDYEVPADAPLAVPPDLAGGGAKIQVAGERVPAGCVLLVRKGRLATFEGSTLADVWTKHARAQRAEASVPQDQRASRGSVANSNSRHRRRTEGPTRQSK